MSFNSLGLKESLLQAIADNGYTNPTPIQAKAIPAILEGNDVMAAAQTGTGKTAGFTLPLLQLLDNGKRANSNRARALILTPTRELAAQIKDSIDDYGSQENLRSVVVFGGVKINPQLMNMRKGADILVATPGRLLDLYQQNAVNFNDLEVLVLDEADRMLDMGFIRDIQRILKLLPQKRQNLMFSATFSNEIRALAKTICREPLEIDVAPRNTTVEAITQKVYEVKKEDKIALLSTLLRSTPEQTLVFSRTKHGANKLVKILCKDGVTATAIHGNKSQNHRTRALADFKNNKVQVLVATDIAARGIDIDLLAQVINFDLPNVSEDYVHRIGRTGRAGASGLAMSLVSGDEKRLLRDIERLIKCKIERAQLPEFTHSELPSVEVDFSAEVNQNKGQKQGRRSSGSKSSGKKSGNANTRQGQNKQAQGSGKNAENKQNQESWQNGNGQSKPRRRRRSGQSRRRGGAVSGNTGSAKAA
jgi:ATP-dependent RNA helicase RhlE